MKDKMLNPFYQGVLCAIGGFGAVILMAFSGSETEPLIYMSALFFLFYMLGTTIALLFVEKYWIYLLKSIVVLFVLLVWMGMINSVLIDLFELEGSEEASMMFLLIMYYPVSLIIFSFIRLARRKA